MRLFVAVCGGCVGLVGWQVRLVSVQPEDQVRVHFWANSTLTVNGKEVRASSTG